MRIACALALMVGTAAAQPSPRAASVVIGLGVDDVAANKLIDLISRYDEEVDGLQMRRSELKRRLVTAQQDDPQSVEKLLDEAVSNQRALFKADEKLIGRLRGFLSAKQTARLLLLLSVTDANYVKRPSAAQEPHRAHDPNKLWPPTTTRPCDPFAQMHRC